MNLDTSSPINSEKAPSGRRFAWVVSLLLIGLGARWLFSLTAETIHFTDDAALSFGVARQTLHGDVPLAGPPSHLGGRHLGPIYYWYTALMLFLAKGDVVRAIIFESASKFFALCLAMAIGAAVAPERYRLIAWCGGIAALAAGLFHWPVRVPWHSNFLLIVTSIHLAVLWWYCARPSFDRLLVMVLSTSICIQTHLSSLPFVVSTTLICFGWNWRSRIPFVRKATFTSILLLLLTILVWLPYLVFSLSYSTGSLGAQTAHMRTATGHEVLDCIGEFFDRYLLFADPAGGIWIFARGILGAVLILCVASALHRGGQSERVFVGSILAGMMVESMSLLGVSSPIHSYYLSSLIVVCPMLWAIISGELARLLVERSIGERVLIGIGLTSALAVLGNGVVAHWNSSVGLNGRAVESLQHARSVAEALDRAEPGTDAAVLDPSAIAEARETAIYFFQKEPPFCKFQYASWFPDMRSFANCRPSVDELSRPD